LFIRKKEYEEANLNKKLLEHLESTIPLCDETFYFSDDATGITQRYKNIKKRFENKELLDQQVVRIKGLLDSQIPFSAYYAERLEWWKGQFDKKPEPHKLIITFTGVRCAELLEFDNMKTRDTVEREIRELMKNPMNSYEYGGKTYSVYHITTLEPVNGHPDPYTPEEIETWAKEQLEKEMRGWMVVKEGNPTLPTIWPYTVISWNEQEKLACKNAESILNYYCQNYGGQSKELLDEYKKRHNTDINPF